MSDRRNTANRQQKPLKVKLVETDAGDGDQVLHPGWVRATAILLRGLERLEASEAGGE